MERGKSKYSFMIALCAGIGSLSYGYFISIVGSAFTKPDWYVYFGLTTMGPGLSRSNAIISAMQCLFYVGALVGVALYPVISNRFGRRVPVAAGAAITILGGGLMAGSVNSAMFCIARTIAGVGASFLLTGVPIYQAEIAPPHTRGLLVGLHGGLLGVGSTLAQWISVAFYHTGGQIGWRVPLAIQCLFPALIFGLVWLLPESPRWLYMRNRSEDAFAVLRKLHHDKSDPTNSFAEKEYQIIKFQVDLEARSKLSFKEMFQLPHMRKRLILGYSTLFMSQCCGTIIILSYGPIIFATLGFSPFRTALLFAVWTLLAAPGNIVGGYLSDKVGRRLLLITGYAATSVCMICIAVLVHLYVGTTNKPANRAIIFFIFLVLVITTICIESITFIYVSEIFPSHVRSKGAAFSMSGLFLSTLILTATAPTALTQIGWRYYIVFAALTAWFAVVLLFFWPETKGYTLEQLGKVFGDEVVNDNVADRAIASPFSAHHEGDSAKTVTVHEEKGMN